MMKDPRPKCTYTGRPCACGYGNAIPKSAPVDRSERPSRPPVVCSVCGGRFPGVARGGMVCPFLHQGPDGQYCEGAKLAGRPLEEGD